MTDPAPNEPGPSTTTRFLHSALAASFSQGWRVMVTFGAILILRRTVPPEDWGLFTWAWVVFLVLGAVRDLGVAYHVMRVEPPRPYGNLLLVEVVWGGALVVLSFVGAPWISHLYVEPHPEMIGVLRALTLYLFFEGLATVPRYFFDGELLVGRTVVPEVLRNLAFVLTAVGLSFLDHGVWALIAGHIASAAVYAATLWLRAWKVMPLHFHRGGTFELIQASLPLAAIWFLLLLTRHIDPLVLGLRFPFDDIGNYTFAYEWATIVSVQILHPAIGRALYPALIALRATTAKLFRTYSLATVFVVAFEVQVALVLMLNAELVLRIVGGEQWTDAPTYLRILALAPLLDPFSRFGGEVLKTQHLDRIWIVSCLLTVLSFGIGGYVLTGTLGGPVGMAWVNLLPLGVIPMAWALWKVAPAGFGRLIRDLAWVYLLPLPGFALVWWWWPEDPWLRLIASCVAAVVATALVGWRFGPAFIAFFRRPTDVDGEPARADG
ncbi:MAG: oligosaccharide flippase family protein [Acidobacteriota bacterium]